MYFTDRGLEELEQRRGDEEVTLSWLAAKMRDFVDDNPEFETAVERLAPSRARAAEADVCRRGRPRGSGGAPVDASGRDCALSETPVTPTSSCPLFVTQLSHRDGIAAIGTPR
jgi:hypothetical protein